MSAATIERINSELARLNAAEVTIDVQPTETDEPLVKVKLEHKTALLEPAGFLEILRAMPDGAGAEEVKLAIQEHATHGDRWATR